ncbi:MAG: ParB/RepB/Spo0J family partition protein [Paracoccaceae bacterium]
MTVVSILLTDIHVADRLRSVDEAWAQAIAASIEENGLLEPLVVRATPDGELPYALVAGAHRHRAMELLERPQVEARVVEMDRAQARLAEIDENLMRREMGALDRAIFLRERKDIYEELHPETGHGKAPLGGKDANIASFSEEVAEKIGLSQRTVQDAVALADMIPPEFVERLRALPIADNAAQLKAFSRLGDDSLKRNVLSDLEGGRVRTVKEALVNYGASPVPTPPREAWELRMTKLWAEGKPAWRRDMLAELQKLTR